MDYPSTNDANDSMLAQMLARMDQLDASMEVKLLNVVHVVDDIRDRAAADMNRLTALLETSRQEHQADRRSLLFAKQSLMVARESNKRLEHRINELENQSKLGNIKIDGKPEQGAENLHQYVYDLAAHLVPAMALERPAILSVYRIGKLRLGAPGAHRLRIPDRPRPIVIVFKNANERNAFYFARSKLKNSELYKGIYLSDDVTQLTWRMRDECRSVAALARSAGAEVRVHGDGVIIDGHKYKHTELNSLPPHFSLAKAKTINRDGEIYFHSEHSYLSNFARSPILHEGVAYPTAEHMFQTIKCKMADDRDRVEQIALVSTALEAKRIADQLTESPEWRAKRDEVLALVVNKKFDQNPHLAGYLIETGDMPLNEATSNSYYGIGATLHSREVRDKSYRGLNKLGMALAVKRKSLRVSRQSEG